MTRPMIEPWSPTCGVASMNVKILSNWFELPIVMLVYVQFYYGSHYIRSIYVACSVMNSPSFFIRKVVFTIRVSLYFLMFCYLSEMKYHTARFTTLIATA